MHRNLLSISILLLLLIPIASVVAQVENVESQNDDGIQRIGEEFKIFPKSKLGNTIYYNNKIVVSRPDLIMLDILEAPGGFVYHGTNEAGRSELGYVGDIKATFEALEGDFYQLVTETEGSKIFRVNSENKIQNLLPRFRSASGLVFNNSDKAAFYHIVKNEPIEAEDGKLRYLYTFRIHIAKSDTPKITTLPVSVSDYSPSLKMSWIDDETLEYSLSDGSIDRFKIE